MATTALPDAVRWRLLQLSLAREATNRVRSLLVAIPTSSEPSAVMIGMVSVTDIARAAASLEASTPVSAIVTPGFLAADRNARLGSPSLTRPYVRLKVQDVRRFS